MATRSAARRAPSSSASPFGAWLGLAALVVVLDQLTKVVVAGKLAYGAVVPFTGWFSLVRAHNRGAAFSMLANADGWQRWFFVAIGLLASAFIVVMLKRHGRQLLFAASIALILGGALGNVVDRLLHGHVIDFLQFRFDWLAPVFAGGYFPAFNVADAAITGGAIGLVVDELRRVRRG